MAGLSWITSCSLAAWRIPATTRQRTPLPRIQELYFDWNEIRVTTARELAESFDGLHQPISAARNLKRTLQSIFETFYRFDLEDLKKQNLGKASQQLEQLAGTSGFTVNYAVQHGLGGHAVLFAKVLLRSCASSARRATQSAKKEVFPGWNEPFLRQRVRSSPRSFISLAAIYCSRLTAPRSSRSCSKFARRQGSPPKAATHQNGYESQ